MTRAQALKAAQALFGKRAAVGRTARPAVHAPTTRWPGPNPVVRHTHIVGVGENMLGWNGINYYGHGPTWEAAVADARERKAKQAARGWTGEAR